jgi:hypothetical protein
MWAFVYLCVCARARLSCCDLTVLVVGKSKQNTRNILEETEREISLCVFGMNYVLVLIIIIININESMEIILNMHYMRFLKT